MKHLFLSVVAVLIGMSAFAAPDASAPNVYNAVVYNHQDSARLVGTWLLPETTTPKAVLVLAGGSGQQDRDETIMNHKPFRAIAERLSKEGYGVLRLDDRGVGGSTGDVANATTADFTRDVAAALAWLDSVSPDAPKGILGHSEGGLIAINLAQDPLCDFIITLGAPAMPGDSIILQQGRAVTQAMMGRYDAEPIQKSLLAIAKSDLGYDEAKVKLMEIMMKQLGAQADLPGVRNQVEMQVEVILSPWYRHYLRYDPAPAITEVSKPWLALNGDKDFQVLPENLELIGQFNPRADRILLPSHNHLFLECTTGLPQEYFLLKGDISETTLQTVVDWLNKHFE